MLVSRIKPCMSKYKHLYGETAHGSLKSVIVYLMIYFSWITVENPELIHATRPNWAGFARLKTKPGFAWFSVNHGN
jgi:hypothetical protein